MDRDLIKDIMLCNWDKCGFDLNQMTVQKGHDTQPCFTEQDKLTLWPWVFKMNIISKLGELIIIKRNLHPSTGSGAIKLRRSHF